MKHTEKWLMLDFGTDNNIFLYIHLTLVNIKDLANKNGKNSPTK